MPSIQPLRHRRAVLDVLAAQETERRRQADQELTLIIATSLVTGLEIEIYEPSVDRVSGIIEVGDLVGLDTIEPTQRTPLLGLAHVLGERDHTDSGQDAATDLDR